MVLSIGRGAILLSLVSPLGFTAPTQPRPSDRATKVVEPLLIDLGANGFQLTSASEGVQFDLNGDGTRQRIAWTSSDSDDAFLAIDTINIGRIEDGRSLLGGLHGGENGFTTLAQLEKSMHTEGPPSDGVITETDAIYARLILWIDANHNGISEGDELRSMKAAGVVKIFTGVVGINERDEHGNIFRYVAQALVNNRYGVPVATEVRSVRFAAMPR